VVCGGIDSDRGGVSCDTDDGSGGGNAVAQKIILLAFRMGLI
jgi:hypothetical protein